MAGMFKQPKASSPGYAPDKDDERQRLAALNAMNVKGGRQTTILTAGLAAPAASPNVQAPRTVLTA
jgi:hypothetical protein